MYQLASLYPTANKCYVEMVLSAGQYNISYLLAICSSIVIGICKRQSMKIREVKKTWEKCHYKVSKSIDVA